MDYEFAHPWRCQYAHIIFLLQVHPLHLDDSCLGCEEECRDIQIEIPVFHLGLGDNFGGLEGGADGSLQLVVPRQDQDFGAKRVDKQFLNLVAVGYVQKRIADVLQALLK